MNRITQRVVRHEGGWALEANGTLSKGFRTREAARKAAKLVAGEHAANVATPFPDGEVTSQEDRAEPLAGNSR